MSRRGRQSNYDADVQDGVAELELSRLQRQYRIMEGDRKAYSEESRVLIHKQRSTVDKLEQDRVNLEAELNMLAQQRSDALRDGAKSKKMEKLVEEQELYQRKIRATMAYIAEIDEEQAKVEKEIGEVRAAMGGVNAATLSTFCVQKQIRVLENRLDKALVRFNKELAANSQLREQIDGMRRERRVFLGIQRKYERDLQEQKRKIAQVAESSALAYEARDEAQQRIAALRERAARETQAYAAEIKELDRLLEQDRKLKEFMAAKSALREDETIRDENQRGPRGGRGDSSSKNDGSTRDGAGDGSADMASLDSVEGLEAAFAHLKATTGCEDVAKLAEDFKEVEDRNFSLFTYASELNNENEALADEIERQQTAIAKLRDEAEQAERRRSEDLHRLEAQLDAASARGDELEAHTVDSTAILDALKLGVRSLVENMNALSATESRKALAQKRQAAVAASQRAAEDQAAERKGDRSGEEGEGEGDEAAEGEGDEEESDGTHADSVEKQQSSSAAASAASAALASIPTDEEFQPAPFLSVLPSLLTDVEHHEGSLDRLVQFLTAIEQRANELLIANAVGTAPRRAHISALESAESEASPAPVSVAPVSAPLLGRGPEIPAGASVPTICPPNPGDADFDSDEDHVDDAFVVPLTREELMARTLKTIAKRERQSASMCSTSGRC